MEFGGPIGVTNLVICWEESEQKEKTDREREREREREGKSTPYSH